MFAALNSDHVLSLVYDMKEARQVTMEDALALAGTTEQELFDALSAQYDPQLAQEGPSDANIIIQNHALEGFRIDGQGNVIFYLTARSDDADDSVQDAVSGGDHMYIWQDGHFYRCEQSGIENLVPLVPAEETVPFDPALWCQWETKNIPPTLQVNGEKPTPTGYDPVSVSVEIQDVLKGNQQFFYAGEGSFDYTSVSIADIPALFDPNNDYMAVQTYVMVDLDSDREKEAVLLCCGVANDTGGYLVLHRSGHDVYGYQTNYRTFECLKTDGAFHYSDYIGTKEGVATINFTEKGLF